MAGGGETHDCAPWPVTPVVQGYMPCCRPLGLLLVYRGGVGRVLAGKLTSVFAAVSRTSSEMLTLSPAFVDVCGRPICGGSMMPDASARREGKHVRRASWAVRIDLPFAVKPQRSRRDGPTFRDGRPMETMPTWREADLASPLTLAAFSTAIRLRNANLATWLCETGCCLGKDGHCNMTVPEECPREVQKRSCCTCPWLAESRRSQRTQERKLRPEAC